MQEAISTIMERNRQKNR